MKYFQEAMDWLTTKLTFGIKPGLERVQWVLNELGNPQDKLTAVHVVGTNGKGSTVNYLRHIFQEAGYEVGTFTSPSIMDFRERIAVNGEMIAKADFIKAVELLKPVVERVELETDFGPVTEFETITLVMFIYFGLLHPVDLVVIEAGLGGRWDSTNVFRPQAVICTSIGLDHQHILGDSHLAIASEKIGVLKEGVPFIFAENRADVRQLFYQEAEKLGSPVYEKGRAFDLVPGASGLVFECGELKWTGLGLAMPGQHQVANASLALMTTRLLQGRFPKVTEKSIRDALAKSYWPGRTEFLRPNLMIDGAHNDESISALVEVLASDYADKTIHLLFAAINPKPATTMLEQLASVGQVAVTTFEDSRAYQLADYPSVYERVATAKDWLTRLEKAEPNDLFVITGSLYFISQVRQQILQSENENLN